MINVVSSSRYKVNRKLIKIAASEILAKNGVGDQYDINFIFIGRNKMRQIATQYKNEDLALPVLSFSYKKDVDNGQKLLGEVFICYPQAVLLAAERNKKVDEMINRLIEHGIKNLLM
jgi:rRNA maturation RNase YbeY